MNTPWKVASALLVSALVLGSAGPARAQFVSVTFQSSMTAQCVGLSNPFTGTAYGRDCELLLFTLDVPAPQATSEYRFNGGTYAENILWDNADVRSSAQLSTDNTAYRFSRALRIWDAGTTYFTYGAASNLWSVSTRTVGLSASARETALAGNWASSPLFLLLEMSATRDDLAGLDLVTYSASGYAHEVGGAGRTASYTTAGTLSAATATTTTTPEPASMLLLGSGLAGVLGAARRRRRLPPG